MRKRDLVVASTRDHCARLVSSNRECFAYHRHISDSFNQQIFFILVCIHAGNPWVPPRVLASGPKHCGGNKKDPEHNPKVKTSGSLFDSTGHYVTFKLKACILLRAFLDISRMSYHYQQCGDVTFLMMTYGNSEKDQKVPNKENL